jgi:hypothetical protein
MERPSGLYLKVIICVVSLMRDCEECPLITVWSLLRDGFNTGLTVDDVSKQC